MKKYLVLAFLAFITIIITNCSDNSSGDDPVNAGVNSCEGCHTNYAHLKAVYSPDTTGGGSSCGGETPHVEPFDRVILGGEGWEEFKKSKHYTLGCVGCHNGVGNTDDKVKAHSGNFLAHPTKNFASEKCKSCHEEAVNNHQNSLHQMGWGQKRKVCVRMGLKDASEFDKLPTNVKEGYEVNCAKCHASTCGDCHITRPKATGGGLMNGHKFTEKPDMVNTCVACHSSRGGHAYMGVASGTVPDVHLTKAGFKCINCHSKDEIHGTGKFVEQRYKYEKLPKCEGCHTGLENKNTYHSTHYKTFSCNTCHSQEYNNCGSCHINGDGARILSYQDFKIGMNPIPEVKTGFKFAVVRHTLMAPDSWEKYGVASLPNFNAFPVFNYATPHNIQRWTGRTKVEAGKPCFDACHIVKDGEVIKNKKWYLFESDLKFDWEKSSSKSVTVDGKLPSSWPK
jgi:thiosulfate/3-mercaptopyruvate sulfurtransferase